MEFPNDFSSTQPKRRWMLNTSGNIWRRIWFQPFIDSTPTVMESMFKMVHTSNLVQHYLKEEFGLHGFVNKSQWPPKSPDLNPLDYWFWNALKEKVYEGRRTPFTSVTQLKRRARRVWQSAINEVHLQKSILKFKKRLNAVVQNEGKPIVHKFR